MFESMVLCYYNGQRSGPCDKSCSEGTDLGGEASRRDLKLRFKPKVGHRLIASRLARTENR